MRLFGIIRLAFVFIEDWMIIQEAELYMQISPCRIDKSQRRHNTQQYEVKVPWIFIKANIKYR